MSLERNLVFFPPSFQRRYYWLGSIEKVKMGAFCRPGLFWIMEMLRTMFLQFFIWLTDGEGRHGGRERGSETGWLGVEIRNRGHWSISSMYHTQQQRVGYRVGGKRVLGSLLWASLLSSALCGCTFAEVKIQSWQEKESVHGILNVSSLLSSCAHTAF